MEDLFKSRVSKMIEEREAKAKARSIERVKRNLKLAVKGRRKADIEFWTLKLKELER